MQDPQITPEVVRSHGITEEEYQRILQILGREKILHRVRQIVPQTAAGDLVRHWMSRGAPQALQKGIGEDAMRLAVRHRAFHRLARESRGIGREHSAFFGYGDAAKACRLEGDPGWSYPEGSPVLDAVPRLAPAWEPSAGRVRPKAPPRPKPGAPADVRVEADLSRPIRAYAACERYSAGDRIST